MSRITASQSHILYLGGLGLCAILSQGCDLGLAAPYMPQEQSTGILTTEVIPEETPERFVNLSDRSFSFSTAPTRVVIWASSSGGNAPPSDVPIYKVFGDGRVEKKYPKQESKTIARLGIGGTARLLELAVAGGLMEWDSDRVQAHVFRSIGGHYSNADASTQEIRIFLNFYRGPEGRERGPVRKVIKSPDTRIRAQLAPDLPELRAAWGLYRALLEAGR